MEESEGESVKSAGKFGWVSENAEGQPENVTERERRRGNGRKWRRE